MLPSPLPLEGWSWWYSAPQMHLGLPGAVLLPLDKSCQLMGGVFPPSPPGRNPSSASASHPRGTWAAQPCSADAQAPLAPQWPLEHLVQVKSPTCISQHCLSSLGILCCGWDGLTAQRPQEQHVPSPPGPQQYIFKYVTSEDI